MLSSKSLSTFLYGDRTPPLQAPRVTPRQTQPGRRVLIRRGGQVRTYRINKYGEIFEEK
jgi:hypothetical protein